MFFVWYLYIIIIIIIIIIIVIIIICVLYIPIIIISWTLHKDMNDKGTYPGSGGDTIIINLYC